MGHYIKKKKNQFLLFELQFYNITVWISLGRVGERKMISIDYYLQDQACLLQSQSKKYWIEIVWEGFWSHALHFTVLPSLK